MSGHSEWAATEHKKAVIDVKHGKLFACLIKNIEVTARTGGGDPAGSPTLSDVTQEAKEPSVPADNIGRTVERGSGAESGGTDWRSITYGGYGPNGVGFIVECLTDSKNRAVSGVRTIFSRSGGNMADAGSVSYQFARRDVIEVTKATDLDRDEVFEAVMEAGTDDVEDADEIFVIETDPSDLVGVRTALQEAGIDYDSAESQFVPSVKVDLDLEGYCKVMRLFNALDDTGGVRNVYMNGNTDDEVISAYGAEAQIVRILGIDPGIIKCDVGVIDIDVSQVASLVYVAAIRNEPDLATQSRPLKISGGIVAAITRFSPEIVALEWPFAKENRQSATTTMQTMGVVMAEVGRAGLPVALYTPSEVRTAASGNGAATRAQMEAMIARILRLDKPPKPADAADTLAVAITHAWRGTGILGSGINRDVSVSLSGGVKTRVGTKLIAAQQIWAQAEAQSRRSGAVRHHSR